ncbi:MAG: copper transporter [Nocardioides sp.]
MISFRYHIVSIVSVFLALAIGVALGGGPLKGEVDNTLVDQVKADRVAKADLQSQISSLKATGSFEDKFAETVAPSLLGGSLKGHVVDVLVLPTASQSDVTALTDFVAKAGGTVGGTLRVGDALVDVGNKQLVDELGTQLLDGTSGVNVPADASPYERMGALIARAVGTDTPGGATVDGAANSVLAGLSTAGMMSAEGQVNRRGDLVLVVAGPGTGDTTTRQGTNSIVTTLVEAIDSDTRGVVLTGPVSSAKDGGVVKAVRADVVAARDVSTVDVLGRTAGQVVSVMALAGQANGQTGHYGAVDAANGAMPGADSSAQ